MSSPIQKENIEQSSETDLSTQILSNLTNEFFTGKNKEILDMFLSELSLENVNQLFEMVISSIEKQVDLKYLNHTNIEQLDIMAIANTIANDLTSSLKNEKQIEIQISENDKKQFDDVLKEFTHVTLHDVAFPMLAMENPSVALSAKNLLKRVISSMQNEGVDLSEVYAELDIENLPVEASIDMFLRLGGNIRGLPEGKTKLDEPLSDDSTIFYCELSAEQAVYLAYTLQEHYSSIKNWKALYHLLKSNGKRYGTVIVCDNKKGILLSVLDMLHEKKTIASVRYFRMNKGNGIWPLLQGYLINSKTDKPYERELRKLRSENDCEVDAKKIIDEIFDFTKQSSIKQTAEEIIKEHGI